MKQSSRESGASREWTCKILLSPKQRTASKSRLSNGPWHRLSSNCSRKLRAKCHFERHNSKFSSERPAQGNYDHCERMLLLQTRALCTLLYGRNVGFAFFSNPQAAERARGMYQGWQGYGNDGLKIDLGIEGPPNRLKREREGTSLH